MTAGVDQKLSLWLDQVDVPPVRRRSLRGDAAADVVVVGAG